MLLVTKAGIFGFQFEDQTASSDDDVTWFDFVFFTGLYRLI